MLVESTVRAADAVICVSPNSSRTGPTMGDPGAGSAASTLPRGGLKLHKPFPYGEISSFGDFQLIMLW